MYLISVKGISLMFLRLVNGHGFTRFSIIEKSADNLFSMPTVPLILNWYLPGGYLCISDVSKLNWPVTGSKVTVPGSSHLISSSNP